MNHSTAGEAPDILIPSRAAGHIQRLATFAAIGAASTAAFVVLYAALREITAPLPANAFALTLTMGANFLANRRYTFQVRGGSLFVHALQYGVAYGLGLAASTLVLAIGIGLAGEPGRTVETAIALASGLVATVIRYVLLSAWVFRKPDLTRIPVPGASR
ncbi:MAG: GtrA family protein [Dehalococcoidia bacterium]|nr:GtrA family protein [Dehalococcoidia bacterium]